MQGNTFRCWMVPFGTKFLLVIPIIILMIEQLTFLKIRAFFVDIPYYVLHEYQCHRLIFAQFVEITLYTYFLCPIILYWDISFLEKRIGTAIFLIDFFLKGILIQIIFILLCLLLPNSPDFSFGFWNFIVLYSTLRAFSDPNAKLRSFNLPCIIIQAKFGPPILIVMDILINLQVRKDVLAALLLGCMEGYFFDTMMFRPSQGLVQMIENSCLFRSFKDRSDFVLSDFNFKANHVWKLTGESHQSQVELLVS